MSTTLHTGTTATRGWLPEAARDREREILEQAEGRGAQWLATRIDALAHRNRVIHELECINLNPATNVMNPHAEAILASGLSSRPSLGYPGAKYEMGLEAIEEIEVLAASLARQVFAADYAEVRVASGAIANAYAFMATCSPGDPIIVPPETIGGHATHHPQGVAGLLGLEIHEAPADRAHYSVDLAGLAALAQRVRPRLITIGSSLNLEPHPVDAIRRIADDTGARVLFDAAHVSGLVAGGVWPNPLDQGADLMTMSTYKSLGGPAGGLVLTNDGTLAERVEAIAYPGMTANFDVAKTAALAIGLLDWLDFGPAYATAMVATARALASALEDLRLPVFKTSTGSTTSHQFALDAREFGGGHEAAVRLREANILSCAIGLPNQPAMTGLRLGTPEIVRWGMDSAHMTTLADLIGRALRCNPSDLADEVTEFRRRFTTLRYMRSMTDPRAPDGDPRQPTETAGDGRTNHRGDPHGT